jgi:branched-chain amino acid transport system substrate-binding protein
MFKRAIIFTLVSAFLIFAFGLAGAAEPIKLGAPLPMTGPFAGDGLNAWRAIKLAVDEINKSGGLLGRPLEASRFDTQDLAPERVMLAADNLVGREKVDVIVAGWAGWGQDVRAYGKYDVPFFAGDASASSIEVFREDPKRYSNVFQLHPVERDIASTVMAVLDQLPYKYSEKTLAVITTDDAWGTEIGSGLKEKGKELGWKTVLDEIVPYGTTEWGPILTKIRSKKPGIIHLEIVSVPEVATFYRQFMKSPTNSLISLGYATSLPDFLPNMGKEANGIVGLLPGLPGPELPNDESKAWAKKHKEAYGVDPPPSAAIYFYYAVKIWAEAVKAVGDVKNYDAINDYIRKGTFKMMHSTIKFDEDQKVSAEIQPPNTIQISDGIYYCLYTSPGNRYKNYEFRVPPWIKK